MASTDPTRSDASLWTPCCPGCVAAEDFSVCFGFVAVSAVAVVVAIAVAAVVDFVVSASVVVAAATVAFVAASGLP